MQTSIGLVASALLLAGTASATIVNPNFSPEQTYSGTTTEIAGPDGWILRDLENRRAVVTSVDFARSGTRVFRFPTPTSGFGDNKLDQCMPLTAAADFAFSFHAWTSKPDSNLRARVNIESYPTEADCDGRDNRLDNSDFDFRIEGNAGEWQAFSKTFSINPNAGFVRLSLRLRDRTDGGNPAEPPIQVFFDDISVIGATLVNGDFEDTTFTEGRFSAGEGPLGWVLNNAGESGLVVPEASALDGSAFRFSQLFTDPEPSERGFGDNSLEQCVPITSLQGVRVGAGVSVWPELLDSDLRVRLNVDLYPDESTCLQRQGDSRLRQIQNDFRTSAMVREAWNELNGDTFVVREDEHFARIALRVRDRRESLTEVNTPVLLFDQARLDERPIAIPVMGLPLSVLLAVLLLMTGLSMGHRGGLKSRGPILGDRP